MRGGDSLTTQISCGVPTSPATAMMIRVEIFRVSGHASHPIGELAVTFYQSILVHRRYEPISVVHFPYAPIRVVPGYKTTI